MLNNITCSLFSIAHVALGYSVEAQQQNTSFQDVRTIISQGILALGGYDRISAINNMAYVGNSILRSKSMLLSVSTEGLDAPVMCTGRQNLTFSYDRMHVKQRIDRHADLGPIWTFARPDLKPMEYSFVIEGGDNGFAAVVEGSYSVIDPDGEASGYVDGLLASYLITEAYKWDPLLLLKISTSKQVTARTERSAIGDEVPAVYDESTGIAILFDSDTHLPHIIRSYEDHPIFGPSTHDLLIYNYTDVGGVKFPQRFKTIYNNKHVTADYAADRILINVDHAPGFFIGPGNGTVPEASSPTRHPDYSFAEIGEFSDSFVWPGAYTGTLETLDAGATQVYQKEIPGFWILKMIMSQAVIELEDGSVIVLDAPPHQSKVVIKWVRHRLGKEVTHVWPTHHHHDHALGIGDYVKIGAKMIVPDFAAHYYAGLNSTPEQIITYQRGQSITFADSKNRVTFIDMQATLHAHDHGYAVISPSCPTADSPTVVFEADHAAADLLPIMDQGLLQELLTAFLRDKVPRSSRIFPAHGRDGDLTEWVEASGIRYPYFTPLDFIYNQPNC